MSFDGIFFLRGLLDVFVCGLLDVFLIFIFGYWGYFDYRRFRLVVKFFSLNCYKFFLNSL